jgi:hypothetical protein
MKVTTTGIDLAKNGLQVHGVDEQGKVALPTRSNLVRRRICLRNRETGLH